MSNTDLSTTHVPARVERSTPIRTLHVLVLGGLSALGPLSTDMYLPALPAISHELGATMAQTQLTLSAGMVFFWDMSMNYTSVSLLYNSHLVNRGAWANGAWPVRVS